MAYSKRIGSQAMISTCIGSIAFFVYVTTAPKGLSWDLGGADSGELAAGVMLNGLVHSPGYPTYLLLAQIVKGFPVGPFALRMVIFSAFAAALTTGFLVYIGWGQQRQFRPISVTTTAVIWGLNELVWTQAVIVEVYALASVFGVLLLYLTLSIKRDSNARYWVLWGIVLGVGIGSHYFVGLVAVFAGLWFISHQQLGIRQILYGTVGVMVGLSVFLWLPLRAGEVLLSNWGNPNTIERFWWVVRGAAFSDRLDLAVEPQRVGTLIGLIARQLTPVGIVLILLGFIRWWKQTRKWVQIGLPVIMLNLWIVAGYSSDDTLPYLYPALFIFALAAGEGIVAILNWIEQRNDQPVATLAIGYLIVILLGGLLVSRTFPMVNQATVDAEIFGRTIVQNAAPNTIILSDEGHHSFALRYAVANEQRLDIVPIDLSLLFYDWYRADLVQQLELDKPLDVRQNGVIRSDLLLEMLPKDQPIITTLTFIAAPVTFIPNEDGLTYVIER